MFTHYSVGHMIYDEPNDAKEYALKHRIKYFYGISLIGQVVRFLAADYTNQPAYIDAKPGIAA